jgi:hypothetical protein
MPDTKTDPLVEIDHPTLKMDEQEDFKQLKKFSLEMYTYTTALIDANAKLKARIEAARSNFYTSYHDSQHRMNNLGSMEERVDAYAEFMRGMWELMANREKQGVDTPADWSLIWQLEETCEKIYPDDWDRRFKV